MEGIKVAVRVRPMNQKELDSKCTSIIRVEDNVLEISCPKENRGYRQPTLPNCTHHFTFDKCYVDLESSSTSSNAINEDVSSGLLQCVTGSYNASAIVFGQKGSGKTFTVMGKETTEPGISLENDGIIQNVCEKLFSYSNKNSDSISVTTVSCLEIYNNHLIDLMHDGTRSRYQKSLHIREHPDRGPFVEGLIKYTAKGYEDLMKTIYSCASRRKIQTWEPYASSRSHLIVGLQYKQANFTEILPNEIMSNVSIIDLADRVTDQSCNIKLSRSEAECMNRCLFAFYDVVKSLADAVDRRGTRRKSIYVPFRDSLLTWLLKDSIGGNSMTFMIATISQADCSYCETVHTLQTASRAHRIINRPSVNSDWQVTRLKHAWEENRSLRSTLADYVVSQRPRSIVPTKQFANIQEKLKKNEETIHESMENWICKWESTAATLSPSAKDLVKTWKENRQHLLDSHGSDSAFGSDLEADIDSKSPTDDFDGSLSPRLPRNAVRHRSTENKISARLDAKSPSLPAVEEETSCTTSCFRRRLRLPVKVQNTELHSSDSLRAEIKEQLNSLRRVAKKLPVVPIRQEPLTSQDVCLTVISRAQSKLRHSDGGQMHEEKERKVEAVPVAVVNVKPILPPNESMLYQKLQPSSSAATGNLLRAPSPNFFPNDIASLFLLLSKEFNQMQDRISELLSFQQRSIISLRKVTAKLIDDVTVRLSTVGGLIKRLKQLTPNCDDLELHASKLDHYDKLMASLERIFQINQILRMVENNMQLQQYQDLAADLSRVRRLISAMNLEDEFQHKASRILTTELSLVQQRVLCHLIETWDRMVKWHIPSGVTLQGLRGPVTVSLDLSLIYWQSDVGSALVQAMENSDVLNAQIDGFCDLLLAHFIQNVVSNRNTLLQVVEDADRYLIHVTSRPIQHQVLVTVSPAAVFQKIEQIFKFLERPMSRIKIVTSDRMEETLMGRIGRGVSKRLFDIIYSECLSQTLHRDGVTWVTFDQLAKATESFQDAMSHLKLVPGGSSPLSEHLNAVGTHFGQVRSQELLKKAHDFVTSDLGNFEPVSVDHPLGKPKKKRSIEREEFVKHCKEKVRTANYKLPTCQISNPVRSLVCLAYDTLMEASSGSRKGATHLCDSVRNMFELYCDMIPFYHQEKVRTLPLLAALHHNNCMFVAHHLITIDKVFRREVLPIQDSSCDESESSSGESQSKTQLGVLVSRIRRLGNQGFGEHVEIKQKELTDNLSSANGFVCAADEEGVDSMTAVRDMTHHLKQVSLIWREVLPTNIYCRAIGTLLNSALKDIVESVTGIEEFSIEDCQHLQKVLSYIQDSIEDLFPPNISKSSSTEVIIQENVSNWMKFKELVMFFRISLVDIADRWAGGKGPMAMHFTATEVAKLVMAMFENTSRRRALLTELRKSPSVYKC